MANDSRSRPDEHFDHRDIAASNVSGSTAGASSGDFHVYRQQRRRELDRLERMEQEAKEREVTQAQINDEIQRELKEQLQTQKRAAKRKKKKALRNERRKLKIARTDALMGKDQGSQEKNDVDEDGGDAKSKTIPPE